MAVELRYARRDEYSRISAFLDEFWARDHVYCRNRALFDWTFARSTHWPDDQYSFALAEEDGRLVGILGGIPFTFNDRGRESNGVWIVNYVVHPDHRRGTIALQLLSMFRRPDFHPVIAFGINPATAAIYRVLRGRVLPVIPRHFLALPGCEDRMQRLLLAAHPDWEAGRAAELASRYTLDSLPGEADFRNAPPAAWDVVDWPHLSRLVTGAARDLSYFTWRYMQHPDFVYRFIVIGEGSRHGLAVWRLEMIRKAGDRGREDVDRIGRVVEFLPVSGANARLLVGTLLGELKRAGAFAADYYGFHGGVRRQLRESGFFEVAEADNEWLPARFQPLDGKGGGILSAMFVHSDAPECDASAECPWYWTKSDSDQDRPN